MPAKLSDADYAVLAEFRFSLRRFLAFSESRAADCGLTPQQHQALLAVRAAPAGEATVGYVADRLILKPHSATGLIDRLVELSMVERQVSPKDKRKVLLVLTEEAHARLARLSAVHREEIVRLRPMLVDLMKTIGD